MEEYIRSILDAQTAALMAEASNHISVWNEKTRGIEVDTNDIPWSILIEPLKFVYPATCNALVSSWLMLY